jgi:transcriptional regulator with XRE-family HTH domain
MKKQEKTIGQRLIILRESFSDTVEDFANRVGLTRGGIEKIERDGSVPRHTTIKVICDATGCSETWLTEGNGEMFPDGKKELQIVSQATKEPWKDEAYLQLKQERDFLRDLINRLTGNPALLGKDEAPNEAESMLQLVA